MMNIEQIGGLMRLLSENGLKKLEWTDGDTRLTLEAREGPAREAAANGAAVPHPDSPSETPAKSEPDGFVQKSPVVGTVYLSASPGEKPFVAVGDAVAVGQTLCVVEAMKMFSSLTAQAAGIIREICVENGQPVGVGQALFRIAEERAAS